MEDKAYSLAKNIGKVLREKGLKLAVAESCTGGLLSSVITDVSGSSEYFVLGIVAYSPEQKEKLLKIPKKIIDKYTAVSEEVAMLMAENVRKFAKADIGVGITGYAGPSGGTVKNPAGTVYISVVSKDKSIAERFIFKGKRKTIKRKAVSRVLSLVCKILKAR